MSVIQERPEGGGWVSCGTGCRDSGPSSWGPAAALRRSLHWESSRQEFRCGADSNSLMRKKLEIKTLLKQRQDIISLK